MIHTVADESLQALLQSFQAQAKIYLYKGLDWKERNAFQVIESVWWSQLINKEQKAHNLPSRDWKHIRFGHKKREKEQWDKREQENKI